MKTIRVEIEKDYKITENLKWEALWNLYQPGFSEHYVLNRFRKLSQYFPELSLVMELEGKIIDQIMYFKAVVNCDKGNIFLSLSLVWLVYSQNIKARNMGFGVIAITGSLAYHKIFQSWGILSR